VIEAKLPVLALAQATLRRAMCSRRAAARPFADGTLVAERSIPVRLHPDAIEQRRVDFHNPPICAHRELSCKSRGRVIASLSPTRFLTGRPRFRNASHMHTRDAIRQKLRDAFAPARMDVADESHLHEGHAGHRPGGETHFRVYIVADSFTGKSRLDRHRMINRVLSSELATGVHALAIHALAPGEDSH
jgi:BolA protein